MAIVTVKKGDTLWEICLTQGLNPQAWKEVAQWNKIPVKDNIAYIYVGEKVATTKAEANQLHGTTTKKTTTLRADVNRFGLQADTDSTVFATWNWSRSGTEHYETKWYYYTNNGMWFVGQTGTETDKQSIYNAPANATKVKFIVKPVATKNKNGSVPWTASWSTEKVYNFNDNPPKTPPVPTVSVDKYTLTAEVNNLDVGNAQEIEFWLRIDQKLLCKKGKAAITQGRAVYKFTIEAGKVYTVRCRALRGDQSSDWSAYSDVYSSVPATPAGITTIRASSKTSVYLEWASAVAAKTYELEYTTKKEYFSGSNQITKQTGIETTQYDLSGLESGQEYFFRVRAVNDKGESGWSDIASVVIGKKPAAPTTWSSTTTAITGNPLNLYWIHNSEDGSSQTFAELELIIDGVKTTYTIENSTDEDEKDKTSVYAVDTSKYTEGTQVLWRVRTAGITKEYGEWSVQRTIDIYAPPSLDLSITDFEENEMETLTSFPFYIYALAGPNTQAPISYYMSIISTESYETVDNLGNAKTVNAGNEVYSKHFDVSDALLVEMSASNVNLENNITYTIKVMVSMNSGLTAEATYNFKVAWTDETYEPNMEIAIDTDSYSAYIKPYCVDENDEHLENVTLSVYRREFDGSFTEIGTGLDNASGIYVTDPHPSLDYARYRIVATSTETGATSYYDPPGHPVGCKAAIIQWDEEWSEFDVLSEDPLAQPAWTGSLLAIPYNIDITEGTDPDISLIEYIGRSHPVSYYGTQVGETQSWRMEIPKSDKETLYGLRRLSKWMGDVYVREPSGCGFWANVNVSYNQKHLGVTIPITLSVTRVEGGM